MDHMDKKPDRRVLKTKKAIRNAFSALLSEKDINTITIKDIADAADINRKTFYNHYNGIYQIVDELENEIVSAFSDIIGEMDFQEGMENPYQIFTKLTAVIHNDLEFYSHLLKVDSNSSLVGKITGTLREKMADSFSLPPSSDPLTFDVMAEYMFSGMIAVYKSWFNSNRAQSIEEMSKIVSTLTISGVKGVLAATGEGTGS